MASPWSTTLPIHHMSAVRIREILGEVIVLTLPALLVLKDLHGGKGSAASNELMTELALVVGLVLVVHLVVLLLSLAPAEHLD